MRWLRMIGREIADGSIAGAPMYQLTGAYPEGYHMLHDYPELRCYRDIAFYWKWFLNPDRVVFPNAIEYAGDELPLRDYLEAQLNWQWDSGQQEYKVYSFGIDMKCRPDPSKTDPVTGKVIPPDKLPKHRYPSTATPSFYVAPPPLRTEDDAIYRHVCAPQMRTTYAHACARACTCVHACALVHAHTLVRGRMCVRMCARVHACACTLGVVNFVFRMTLPNFAEKEKQGQVPQPHPSRHMSYWNVL